MAEQPIDVLCLACEEPADTIDFKPAKLQRRALKENDILVDMKYCGVCHTDCVVARGAFELMAGNVHDSGKFVPGHELAGVVTAVGPAVTKFKVGDHAGVGCMVDSCLNCDACNRGEEQMCMTQVGTYGFKDANGRAETYPKGNRTLGGYTDKMVIHERFGIPLPKDYPLEMAGPVMCAGVTMYDPLKRQGAKEGTRVGIIGLGGLGLTGVKIAKMLGCKVTAISRAARGSAKAKGGLDAGADDTLCSQDPAAMEGAASSFDLIINTIPRTHDWTVYEALVVSGGHQVLIGVQPAFFAGLFGGMMGLLPRNVTISSTIGGIQNTQEIVELFAKHKVYPQVQVRPAQDINDIMAELEKGNESSMRYVLDMKTLTEQNIPKHEGKPAVQLEEWDKPSAGAIFKSLGYMKFWAKTNPWSWSLCGGR
jgi:D-arabinose 1-dehydrogenase-like Zn-dependent alcohol dehydrogenase